MARTLEPSAALAGLTAGGVNALGLTSAGLGCAVPKTPCHHCGEPCETGAHGLDDHSFCCLGCQTVFALLRDSGLGGFYSLGTAPGVRAAGDGQPDRWGYLDDPTVGAKLLDFTDGRIARVRFQVPTIHCVACVWLLENLCRLHPAIGRCRVDFARRELALTFDPGKVRLSEVVSLLARLGYEPSLSLADLERKRRRPNRRLSLQIGVAGFAFGNIMLLSLPLYLGLDSASGPMLRGLFGGLSLVLALPVVLFSASDYWRSAWASFRQRTMTLDVPIAAGIAALYGQSAWEILAGGGEGYLDSLAGLVFFLLCGRAFQQKTHERLAFDRDYRGFFPLGVVRRSQAGEETVPLSKVEVGDHLVVRNGDLVPADARLVMGDGLVDYSFVTGESDPVTRGVGERLFAGGRQVGGALEVEIVKPVSEGYLTSLWNDDAFRKPREDTFNTLTHRYSRRFTRLVILIAVGAAAVWTGLGEGARGIKAFTSVLIVACPCALALAAPLALGTAQRILSRLGVCLRNSQVVETIAKVDAVALDKTGTLTSSAAPEVHFAGASLTEQERRQISALSSQSSHPYARTLARLTRGKGPEFPAVTAFREEPGSGMAASVAGREFVMGSEQWLMRHGVGVDRGELPRGSTIFLAMDGRYRGVFVIRNRLRPEVDALLKRMRDRFEVSLVSGDNEGEQARFSAMLGDAARLHFNVGPREKLAFIRQRQEAGRTVMMVGDGLNDAGALCQGDVGVAVVEHLGKFSPASDVILEAGMVHRLEQVIEFCRRTARIVRFGFGISALYNAVGVAIAAAGILSPFICAVLMPLSSVTVVLFAAGATSLAARRVGLDSTTPAASENNPTHPR